MSQRDLSRRTFIQVGGAALAAAAAASHGADRKPFQLPPGKMPQRVLGKTGVSVSVLGLGGVGATTDFPTDEEAVVFIRACIDAGINYLDTAPNYGDQGDRKSERRIGKALVGRRREVFLNTKIEAREAEAAMRQIEDSLKLLQTDYLDGVQIHCVQTREKFANWGKPDGIYTLLAKLKQQKVIRFIGLTGHVPRCLKEGVTRYDFDTILMTLNPTKYRQEFEDVLFPVIIEKNLGRIAMKVFGGARAYNRNTTEGLPGRLVGAETGRTSAAALLRYGLSLPVHTAICGIADYRQLRENLVACYGLTAMPADERRSLEKSLEQSHAFLAYPRTDYAYA
jgi:aryl-alcohol dehydrogenase-like predicted oxidoreductase